MHDESAGVPQPETAAVTESDQEAVARLNQAYRKITDELAKVIVGQQAGDRGVADRACSAGGHCLLVGVPGLAKTLLISHAGRLLNLSFNRIQFTPDLMPSDITGTDVIEEDKTTGDAAVRASCAGPIFANMMLADEINRTPPKTQAALLEAMQEHQVTAGGKSTSCRSRSSCWRRKTRSSRKGTYPLPRPSSTGSCSTSWWAIPRKRRNSRSCG